MIDETENEIVVREAEVVSTLSENDQYGHFLRPSNICPICLRPDRNAIHLARARDHQTLDEIVKTYGVSKKDLQRHFENHYRVSTANQDIINIYENTDSAKRDIINSAFEGTLDIVHSTSAILRNYATRLNVIQSRLNVLSDELERDMLEEEETEEFIRLNALATDITKNMLKAYQVIDKKLFPTDSTELWNSVLAYKLDSLGKLLDGILIVFAEFEKKSPEYNIMIQEIKESLRLKFNKLEEEILNSGGSLNPNKGE